MTAGKPASAATQETTTMSDDMLVAELLRYADAVGEDKGEILLEAATRIQELKGDAAYWKSKYEDTL